ncbi:MULTISPECIES: hypothetical protein [Leptolyngbya]|jgi:hypothetical protein|uniref:hypothetical protein n=1 Tax=Leptolyngbya TaxID=47251 RepID=UPI00035FB447|nr:MULTISPECIES: hypothetical protein [Leptolyngbya]MBD2371079.1 hypothetical protein [Leptolyngbya sp. FACHB-161]MBD2377547.1 hypothetical protein [Leptolyngbya sp. FACHB-238]MBD2402000.1 hypothetical protein [Leptolyngbya sp. FACHB-239]MBD2408519.1 hypothetical protein [Leptolyngbya sp. FACHB-402]BAS60414.1 hypothetical protein LBWT_Y0020 [Leptolyngbya boryana IAM M-101]
MAQILNFNAAQRAKQLKQPIHAIVFPIDDRPHCFYPEMGESSNPTKPILGSYVYNCFSIRWAEADDTTVRTLLKTLRIRPKVPGIEHAEFGNKDHYWHKSPFGNSGFFKALVTMPAYSKLVDAGVVSTETLLD